MKRLVAIGLCGLIWACHPRYRALPDGLLDGPASRGGVLHPVEKGQTLWRIARDYGVTLQELAEVNNLPDPAQLQVGMRVWIPGAERVRRVEPAPWMLPKETAREGAPVAAKPVRSREQDEEERSTKVELRRGRLDWPVKGGTLTSRFGPRDGTLHDGIDVAAPKGSPVLAADAGEVLWVGAQRGYGNLVILRHVDGLLTLYAHNDEQLVSAGDRVRRGQAIARVGETGRATGPHVHFEVRQDRMPRNPLFFLPAL
jgi:lipoprotein NlpD